VVNEGALQQRQVLLVSGKHRTVAITLSLLQHAVFAVEAAVVSELVAVTLAAL
jgi:hypothetical protein